MKSSPRADRQKEKRKSSIAVGSLALAITWCIAAIFLFFILKNSAVRAESELCSAISRSISNQVSEKIYAILKTAEQFRDLLLADADKNYNSLRDLAAESLASAEHIRSISIAPGAIIRYSFPEETASSAIGHDLLDNPERMQALVRAVSGKKAVLQGPSVSADGEKLAFLRLPVFDKNGLWGFVSIAFDVDKMLQSLKIPVQYPGMSIALSTKDPSEGPIQGTQIFWGDQNALSGYETTVKLGSDSSEWSIKVASKYPATRAVWWGLVLTMLNVVGAIIFFVHMMAGHSGTKVKSKTSYRLKNQSESRGIARESIPGNDFAVKPFVPNLSEETASKSEPLAAKAASPSLPVEEIQAATTTFALSEQQETFEKSFAPSEKHTEIEQSQEQAAITPEQNAISVLVVDDSEVNREILLRMLAIKNYEALAVESGIVALSTLQERTFDVVLIDSIMPNMDGFALAREIRKNKTQAPNRNKPVILIAMSPSHDVQEAERSAQAGFDSLLVKPFTMTALDQKIREHVLQ